MRRLLVLVMIMTLAGASASPGAILCQGSIAVI
jgi:hypothetical protein